MDRKRNSRPAQGRLANGAGPGAAHSSDDEDVEVRVSALGGLKRYSCSHNHLL